MKKGEKFEYEGRTWIVISVSETGLIVAECVSEKSVPAVQPFREIDGKIVRC